MLKSKRAKKVLIIIIEVLLVICLGMSIFFGVITYQLNQIPEMTFNIYIGFDKEKQIAVVVLSYLAPNFRIPATVMGIKLLTDLQINREL